MPTLELKTSNGLVLATSYTRVVHGGRGDYIEFTREQLILNNLHIPPNQNWRVTNPDWSKKVFYIEHRSNDERYVKVYEQLRLVDYADYKIGYFYIAPGDLEPFIRD